MRERLYTANHLGDNAAVPVKLVHINKCLEAGLCEYATPGRCRPTGNSIVSIAFDNLKILRENPQVREKVAMFEAEPFTPSDNVDAQLYNGFFSDADRSNENCAGNRAA